MTASIAGTLLRRRGSVLNGSYCEDDWMQMAQVNMRITRRGLEGLDLRRSQDWTSRCRDQRLSYDGEINLPNVTRWLVVQQIVITVPIDLQCIDRPPFKLQRPLGALSAPGCTPRHPPIASFGSAALSSGSCIILIPRERGPFTRPTSSLHSCNLTRRKLQQLSDLVRFDMITVCCCVHQIPPTDVSVNLAHAALRLPQAQFLGRPAPSQAPGPSKITHGGPRRR